MTELLTIDPPNQSLSALIQVMATASAALDACSLAQAALERAIAVTELTGGSVWVRERDTMICLACCPDPLAAPSLRPDAAILRVLKTGRPELQGQGERPDAKSAILPLMARGERIGAIVFVGMHGDLSNPLLAAIAGVIAGALGQVQLAEQVETQRHRLQAIKRQQDELISIVSHDLKNPMASIKGYADLLLRRSARNPDDPNRRGLQVISQQIVRMNDLLDTLLDISRIAGERLRIERRPADLARTISDLVEELRETSERRELTLAGAEAACSGTFDVGRIRQVIQNVVNNAIAYSPAGSPVAVRLCRDNREAIIAVHDHGIGIPSADHERIFEPFFRASNAGRTGMGMGLFVARQIMARHGGRIWFESAAGEGSTFYIALPLDPTR